MQTIKAIIFDLDGTLANTIPLCIEAFRQAVEPLINRTLSDDEILAQFGPSEEGTIMALAPGHYDKGINDFLSHYLALHYICPTPFAGMEALLQSLKTKGVKLALVTGKGRNSTNISLQHFGLASYFDSIETGSPNGPVKEQGIQKVLNEFFGIAKEQTIYVGDSVSDITASRRAGITVVAAAWASTAKKEELEAMQPDFLFTSVTDFASWLQGVTGE